MFVAREISNNIYDATNITSTGTNPQGWRTAESAAVLSRHRFEVSRSDHPFLFNINPFFMRETEDNCATCAHRPITAKQIVNDLINEANMAYFHEHLHEMFLAFVSDYEGHGHNGKREVLHTYVCLRTHLQKIQQLINERSKQ